MRDICYLLVVILCGRPSHWQVTNSRVVYLRELGVLASSRPKMAILMSSLTYAYHRNILSTERLAFQTISKPIELRGVDIRTVVNAENIGRIIANSPVKRVIFDMLTRCS